MAVALEVTFVVVDGVVELPEPVGWGWVGGRSF